MITHTLTPRRVDNGWIVTCTCGWISVRTKKQTTALTVGQRDHLDRQTPPCPTPGKRRFKTQQAAEHGLETFWRTADKGKTMPSRTYHCPCGAWHTTSKPLCTGARR